MHDAEELEIRKPSNLSEVLLEPYAFICQMNGKGVRKKLIEAFNVWLQIPSDKLEVITEVIQMLHNASLMIDDIEDNSRLRRGQPVTHRVFGLPATLNSANYVYFLALQRVLDLDHPAAAVVFSEQLTQLHEGQGMDIHWRDACVCPSEEEYRYMVDRKTGALFGLAVRLMQLFSSNDGDFRPLCTLLGLYFQIRDDFANLCSEEYKVNKSFCEDLTEGKFSFPIIHGISVENKLSNSDSSKLSGQVLSILRQRTTDLDVKKYCVTLLDKLGSFYYTKDTLLNLERRCTDMIGTLGGNVLLEGLISDLSLLYTNYKSPLQNADTVS